MLMASPPVSGRATHRPIARVFSVLAVVLLLAVAVGAFVQVPVRAETRDPLKHPFLPESVWNLPIGASAVYVHAGLKRATAQPMHPDVDVLILEPGAPMTPVYYNDDAWGTVPGRCNAEGGALFSAPIPNDFIVLGSGMGGPHGNTPNYATAILDADGRTLIQGQPFARCSAGGAATIWWAQRNERIDGLGITGAHGGSMLSSIGGTIRLGELVPGGTIPHALKLNLNGDNYYPGLGSFRWPAIAKDSCAPGCYTGTVPAMRIGALLALRPDFNFALLETEPGRIVARAFQDYGGYAADNAGWSVYGLDTEFSPDGDVMAEFARVWGVPMDIWSHEVPWTRDIFDIFGALHVIDNWDTAIYAAVAASAGTLGAGLGKARVAWAAPFGQTVMPPPPPPPVPPPVPPPPPITPPPPSPPPPSAGFGADFTVSMRGLTARFTFAAWDGTGPYRYCMALGDGRTFCQSGTMMARAYWKAGTYTATLTVTDAAGKIVQVAKTIRAG